MMRFSKALCGLSAAVAAVSATVLLWSTGAQAVPMFARQTGVECAGCHVGAFGPQLTDFGRQFKLNGYTMGGPRLNLENHLSGMAYGGYTHVKGDMRRDPNGGGFDENPISAGNPPGNRFATNDNRTMDQVSVFYGGAITDNIGMMGQATYKDPVRQFSWDNTDIRYADNTEVMGTNLVYGVTINNNPGMEDLWNSTPTWGFPFLAPSLTVTPGYNPVLFNLGQRVVGEGAYVMWNDLLYAQLANYSGLSAGTQRVLGMMGGDAAARLGGFNPYWRLALQHTFGSHYVSLGTLGIVAHQRPGMNNPDSSLGAYASRRFGTDTFTDVALDATYQGTFSGGEHIVTVNGIAIRERIQPAGTINVNSLADNSTRSDYTRTYRANASYYYHNTYGLTLGRTVVLGDSDPAYYTNTVNSLSGKPNWSSWTGQIDYTPFGNADSPLYPYLNMRFFIQYVAYDKFNGTKNSYDANQPPRDASANNTLYTGVWFAF